MQSSTQKLPLLLQGPPAGSLLLKRCRMEPVRVRLTVLPLQAAATCTATEFEGVQHGSSYNNQRPRDLRVTQLL